MNESLCVREYVKSIHDVIGMGRTMSITMIDIEIFDWQVCLNTFGF